MISAVKLQISFRVPNLLFDSNFVSIISLCLLFSRTMLEIPCRGHFVTIRSVFVIESDTPSFRNRFCVTASGRQFEGLSKYKMTALSNPSGLNEISVERRMWSVWTGQPETGTVRIITDDCVSDEVKSLSLTRSSS